MRKISLYFFLLKKPGVVNLNLNHSIIANGLIFSTRSMVVMKTLSSNFLNEIKHKERKYEPIVIMLVFKETEHFSYFQIIAKKIQLTFLKIFLLISLADREMAACKIMPALYVVFHFSVIHH